MYKMIIQLSKTCSENIYLYGVFNLAEHVSFTVFVSYIISLGGSDLCQFCSYQYVTKINSLLMTLLFQLDQLQTHPTPHFQQQMLPVSCRNHHLWCWNDEHTSKITCNVWKSDPECISLCNNKGRSHHNLTWMTNWNIRKIAITVFIS